MLKGIPSILNPELLKIMMEMGHSDELVIADGNFPRNAHPERVVRLDGHGVPEILDAILQFMPLDTYVDAPVILMEVMKGDTVDPVIWKDYRKIVDGREGSQIKIQPIDRFEFYERSKKAYAVVTTSETALYANIILKKGVVVDKK